MNHLTQILSHKTTRLIIWVFIFLLPILFIWQGGDLTDTGFNVTIYHFFFERLNNGVTDSLIFLTEIIGGIWYSLFPQLGVLGIKLLAILFFYANVFFSYKILKALFPTSRLIPFFLLAGVIFSIRCFPIIFNYDLLTNFFLFVLLYLLRFKDKSLNFINIILIGVVTALMILARFPNIFVLILLPIALLFSRKFNLISTSYKKIFQLIIIYGLSAFITFFLFLDVISLLGWNDVYFSNLIDFKSIVSSESESYNIGYVLKKYVLDGFYFLIYLAACSVLFFVTKFSMKKFNYKKLLIVFFLAGLFLFSFYPFTFNYNNSIKYIVPAVTLLSFFYSKNRKKINWMGILLLVFMMIQIAGSNTGIFLKIGLLFLVALPIGLLNLIEKEKITANTMSISVGIYALTMSCFLYLVFVYGIGQSPTIRLKTTYPIEVEGYHGIFTTKEHSEKIKNIVTDLDSVKHNGESMFIYGHQPMLYHLSGLAPSNKEFWLRGNNLADFEDIFNEISKQKQKPILLDTKEKIFREKDDILKEKFLQNNHYKLVKSTIYYDIWIPNE